tara:strand:+ start:130 stop:615 length:486 start_codon:yes stop_codon:yes gene_type:complete
MNLRELTADQKAILARVENEEFTLEEVSDHLDMLKECRAEKIENYLHVINRLQSEEDVVKVEIERLQAMRAVKQKALENVKAWLLMSMADGEKHEFDLFKVSRVKGREVLQVNSTNNIPQKYQTVKTTQTIDKRGLLASLKAGEEIPGVEIATGKASLRIK